jgi:hypothetical protein
MIKLEYKCAHSTLKEKRTCSKFKLVYHNAGTEYKYAECKWIKYGQCNNFDLMKQELLQECLVMFDDNELVQKAIIAEI